MPVDKVRKRDIFQSTPPRGRRRYHKRGDTVMQIISIHSAARAETHSFQSYVFQYLISIHSAARAETSYLATVFRRPSLFQSTPPRGRRQLSVSQVRAAHENFNPLRREGGDFQSAYLSRSDGTFQSTPPRGRRHNNLVHDTFCNEFQSTPPRGRRHLYIFISPSNQYFNPLRREGGDNKNVIVLKDATISIHSAARAETQAPWGNQAHGEFQSTPPRGRRRIGGTSHTKRVDFNPLRREGGDKNPYDDIIAKYQFNPLRREGGDRR